MKRGSVVDKISFPYLRAVEIIEKSSCWMQIVVFPPSTAGGHNGISGGLQKGSVIRCLSQYGHLNNTVTFWEIMRIHEELNYSKSLWTEEISGVNGDAENLTTQH